MLSFRLPGFTVRANGFAFANCYPPGSPVVEIPTPFGKVPIGDAHAGLCGGMVFAAMDGYLHGVKELPPTVEPALFRYFCQRLLDSWDLPFGVLKYYDWQRRRSGLLRMTVAEEWPRIRAQLHRGRPAALGVVNASGYDPRLLVRNHQVLCYGYDLDEPAGTLDLAIYDPNYPRDETSLTIRLPTDTQVVHLVGRVESSRHDLQGNLNNMRFSEVGSSEPDASATSGVVARGSNRFDQSQPDVADASGSDERTVRNPDSNEWIRHSCEGPTVRGVFLTRYRRPARLPDALDF